MTGLPGRRDVLARGLLAGLGLLAGRRAAAWPVPRPAWSLPEPRRLHRFEWGGVHVQRTAFSPGGDLCLGAGDSGAVRVWDTRTGALVRELAAAGAAFLPDGRRLLAWRKRTLTVLALTAGTDLAHWDVPAAVAGASVSPDGQRVLLAHEGGLVTVGPLGGVAPAVRLEGHTDTGTVALAPDGRRVLTASDGDRTVRLWDAGTGEPLRLIHDFRGAAAVPGNNLGLTASFLADGRRVAVCTWGREKFLRVWDAATGEPVLARELGATQHRDAAVSPDGCWVAGAHEDKTVRIRSVATGAEVWREELPEVYVPRAVTWSPCGRFLMAGSHRGWAFVWRLPG